ncbi:right-handed parallel beta-helix repeat-containing protein [Luteococcus sp. H91]|uniref:right-handed parallel beta-helix repeat-containing protein n=1 Tax=Luteococcus sp. H91 TaxID=3139401 RepID=UPI00313B8CE5
MFVAVGAAESGCRVVWEATGNEFFGYGQNCAGNVISALHAYPFVVGARWTSNYFEKCSLTAMYAKSVEDFVCVGNVIRNGITSSQNVASEGAIGYAPSYHAKAPRPRAVITNNIVDSPGGEPGSMQNGISVIGSKESPAGKVVLTGNVLTDCGTGVRVVYAEDILIQDNVVSGGTVKAPASGIRGDFLRNVVIRGNHIVVSGGHAIHLIRGLERARVAVESNTVELPGKGFYGLICAEAAVLNVVSNRFYGSDAVSIRGAEGQRIGRLVWEGVNAITGRISINYRMIDSVLGDPVGSGAPTGTVVAGAAGVRYTDMTAKAGGTCWISSAKGSNSWVKLA